MTVYKLVTQDYKSTYGNVAWKIRERVSVKGKLEMCRNGIHVYADPLVAVLMNPIHANIEHPRMLKCITRCKPKGDQTKYVVRSATPIAEIEVPEMTKEHRIAIAILCAMVVYDEPTWTKWAKAWLSGKDRTADAAYSATYYATYYAAAQDAYATYYAAAHATYSAAHDVACSAQDAYAAADAVTYASRASKTIVLTEKIDEAQQYLTGGTNDDA